jgi:hypothetical protein
MCGFVDRCAQWDYDPPLVDDYSLFYHAITTKVTGSVNIVYKELSRSLSDGLRFSADGSDWRVPGSDLISIGSGAS